MPEVRAQEQVTEYVARLASLSSGDRARLKRDAGKSIAESSNIGLAYRILPRGLGARRDEIYFLVATLYPLADGGPSGCLGASLRRARDKDERKNKGLNRRVENLLDADAGQLSFRLRQTIRLLKSRQVQVDWGALLNDLLSWESPSRYVQKRWAAEYFGHRERQPEPAEAGLD